MVSLRGHRCVDLKEFGKSYWRIHRAMDQAVKYLGRGHRVLFHDPASAMAIAMHYYPGDKNAVESALLHILYDKYCSANPAFKRQLEAEAKLFRRKRRKSSKKYTTIIIDCPYSDFGCPCFMYLDLLFRDPAEARRMCPKQK